jgi:hypothetical protein
VVVGTAALRRLLIVAVALALQGQAAGTNGGDDASGWTLDARCRDGRAQGPYRLRDARGQLRVAGAFDEGVRTGSFFFWRANGVRIAHVPYDDNGNRHGTLATWYDGEPGLEPTPHVEAAWRRNVRDGETRSWYADGRPHLVAEFAGGRLVRATGWSEAGKPLAEADARAQAERDAAAADAEYAERDALIRAHMPRCSVSI